MGDPKKSRQSETARDPWAAVDPTVFTKAEFLRDLERATQLTDEINSDPDEVRKLQRAIADADAGKARVRRRRNMNREETALSSDGVADDQQNARPNLRSHKDRGCTDRGGGQERVENRDSRTDDNGASEDDTSCAS